MKILFMLLIPLFAFAQEPIPDVDPLAKFVELLLNFKTMSPLAIGAAAVVVLTQAIKKFWPNWPYNRLTVSVLSVIYGIVYALMNGANFLNASVLVLITGGGAVAVYEALKGLGILGSKQV